MIKIFFKIHYLPISTNFVGLNTFCGGPTSPSTAASRVSSQPLIMKKKKIHDDFEFFDFNPPKKKKSDSS